MLGAGALLGGLYSVVAGGERERESKMGKYRMDGRIPLKGEDPAEL